MDIELTGKYKKHSLAWLLQRTYTKTLKPKEGVTKLHIDIPTHLDARANQPLLGYTFEYTTSLEQVPQEFKYNNVCTYLSKEIEGTQAFKALNGFIQIRPGRVIGFDIREGYNYNRQDDIQYMQGYGHEDYSNFYNDLLDAKIDQEIKEHQSRPRVGYSSSTRKQLFFDEERYTQALVVPDIIYEYAVPSSSSSDCTDFFHAFITKPKRGKYHAYREKSTTSYYGKRIKQFQETSLAAFYSIHEKDKKRAGEYRTYDLKTDPVTFQREHIDVVWDLFEEPEMDGNLQEILETAMVVEEL